MIADTKTHTLMTIIQTKIKPNSIVYTDGYHSSDILDVSEFHHHRINHGEKFVEGKTKYINGIENFWNQANRHLRKYNVFLNIISIFSSKNGNGDLIIDQLGIYVGFLK